LIGDAGSFLDPLSNHGITEALRDAEALARCLTRTGTFDDLDGERSRPSGVLTRQDWAGDNRSLD